jgi:hypothetical protein
MAAEHIKVSGETATMFLVADLGENIELFFAVVSTSRSELGAPQKGGPEVREGTFVVLSIINVETGFVYFASEGDADINEMFSIHGRDEPTVHITGTVPVVNEESLTFPLTLDLTLQASGPLVRGEVTNEHFLVPGEVGIHAHLSGSQAPATATGTFALLGTTYDLSTLDITSFDAGISTESAGTVFVEPASSEWLL